MEKLKMMLHDGGYSCVVENFDQIFTFSQRGVSDLYDMVRNKSGFLKDARIADKVIGKGAAALMVIGEVKEVYADIISLSALLLLREAGVETDFGRIVPFIQNRDKTGWCPLEKICYEEGSAENILLLIDEFVNSMKKPKILEISEL